MSITRSGPRPALLVRSAIVVAVALGVLLASVAVVPAPALGLVAAAENIRNLQPKDRPLLPSTDGAKRYVALGDSFSSGEGAPLDVYTKDSQYGLIPQHFKAFYGDPADDGYACHRSPHAYPVRVAEVLGPDWGLDFRACSGAKFADLDREQNGEPPQQKAFAGQSADLITMTMGGNDLAFAKIVFECVAEAATYSVVGADCRTREGSFAAGLSDLRRMLADRYAQLERNLRPGGRLVVLGYPRMFPLVMPDTCGAGVGGNIRAENMRWLNSVSDRTSEAIQAAARDVGATYVDVLDLLDPSARGEGREADRHDACLDDDDRRWVNRAISPNLYEGWAAKNWSWHPTRKAHGRMAELVASCVADPMICDSPERRAATPAEPGLTVLPCRTDCPGDWPNLKPGRLTSDGPGMTETLFQALYLTECEASRGGPGAGTSIERVVTGDLTGDGLDDAVVVSECVPSTSSWPEHVVVLDGAGGSRVAARLDPEITDGRLVATSARPATTLEDLEPAVENGELALVGKARSSAVASADEADYAYRQTFLRSDDAWSIGQVELSRRFDDQSDGPTDDGFDDGTYVAYLNGADPVLSTATFDVAQYFDRSSAATECAADGRVASGAWCTDYYIRNTSDVLRILPVSSGASPSEVGSSGSSVDSNLTELASRARGSDGPLFRIEVRGGEIADIDEIYLP